MLTREDYIHSPLRRVQQIADGAVTTSLLRLLAPKPSAEVEETGRQQEVESTLWSRRDFLGRLGWAGFGAFSLIGLLAAVRSAFPRVLFLPPSKFKAGMPTDYPIGEVSEKYKQD